MLSSQYEGPLTVLHTMMVDPSGIIKKPGGKDLAVAQGEILDVIQLTNDKKALCRNQYRRCRFMQPHNTCCLKSLTLFYVTVSRCRVQGPPGVHSKETPKEQGNLFSINLTHHSFRSFLSFG